MYYCPWCVQYTLTDEEKEKYIPKFPEGLPFRMHIIRRPTERATKSSAIPLALLCPQHINLYSFPEIPSAIDPKSTVILFPSEDAHNADTWDWSTIKDVIAIDSTWLQTKAVLAELPQDIPKIKIEGRSTTFWRYQFASDSALATAEAIHLCYKLAGVPNADDLLFFYNIQKGRVLTNGKGGYEAVERARQERINAHRKSKQRKGVNASPRKLHF